jgi:hypothetical protein
MPNPLDRRSHPARPTGLCFLREFVSMMNARRLDGMNKNRDVKLLNYHKVIQIIEFTSANTCFFLNLE